MGGRPVTCRGDLVRKNCQASSAFQGAPRHQIRHRYVASEITKTADAICAPIAPYEATRNMSGS